MSRVQPGLPKVKPVTDPDLDAPDGAVVDGYERVGNSWVRVVSVLKASETPGVVKRPAMKKSKIKLTEIKLTEAQFNFLSDLVLKGPQSAVLDWSPGRKVAELSLATPQPESFSRALYTATDAGREHHRAIYMADRKCPQCKKAPWTCRVCSRQTCEHHCSKKKNDGTALCGRQACQEGKPVPVPATQKLSSLSKGDVIVVGSSRLRVTIVDRSTDGIGPVVELVKTAKPNTHYTLVEHRREPGKFALASIHQARVIDGWRMVEAKPSV